MSVTDTIVNKSSLRNEDYGKGKPLSQISVAHLGALQTIGCLYLLE